MNQTTILTLSFTLPFMLTALGAALIFFFTRTSKAINCITIGLASGIMLSALIFSLLLPSFEYAQPVWNELYFIPVSIGFVIGVIFMIILDCFCGVFFKKTENSDKKRAFKLWTAITIHNIPEGMAVGFAVGSAISTQNAMLSALFFALGIALQNFPEGLATALPIYSSLKSRKKAFWLAILSGIVEPIFAIVGYFVATSIGLLLPWLLSVAAGSMLYIIIEELLPEIIENNQNKIATISFVIGFLLMMLLDICL